MLINLKGDGENENDEMGDTDSGTIAKQKKAAGVLASVSFFVVNRNQNRSPANF